MSETIFNPDGTVYMTLPDPVPSAGDLEGWTVRHVMSGTHGPECPHTARSLGTHALVRTDVESFNDLLRDLTEFEREYGYRPRSSRITDSTYRWTFERYTRDGHRLSDMIIASKIG